MKRETALLLAPGVLVLTLGFVLPVLRVLTLAFDAKTGFGLDNFARFFADSFYPLVAWRTVRLSLVITLVTALFGAPLALVMARAPRWLRMALIVVVVLPLMTSVVVRTFGWLVILGRGGLLAQTLAYFDLAGRNFSLMHTETGVVLAMVQVLMPFVTLTVLSTLEKIDPRLEEAARVMGANFWTTLRHVVVPLAMPGLVAGSLLVFALSASSFVTPGLIGGVRLPVLGATIYQQVTGTLDWGFAAAQATLLLILALVVALPYAQGARRAGASR
ncbi:MAG: ABC transporter permease [Methylobacteriaceae bacterium]|nr:ABC transporter permease [Methylobacteriaceae bacterium]